MIYFNEFDRQAAAWLRELSKERLIPEGLVDERSINKVEAKDLEGYRQHHFFAGIGGWSEALRLAGWPESIPVWTGSCPCQPFSQAGKKRGNDDVRNLWPEFFRLIRECSPVVVFGEQVENAIGFGWLDGVFADLEGEGYTCGATVLGAHSAGADHIRQRLFWVAHTGQFPTRSVSRSDSKDSTEWLAQTIQFTGCGEPSGMGDSNGSGLSEQCRAVSVSTEFAAAELRGDVGFWGRFDLIPCRDGKTRRIEPGSSPLVDGFPGRVGLLRGYGNAIVPQVAARFITAFMQSVGINA